MTVTTTHTIGCSRCPVRRMPSEDADAAIEAARADGWREISNELLCPACAAQAYVAAMGMKHISERME